MLQHVEKGMSADEILRFSVVGKCVIDEVAYDFNGVCFWVNYFYICNTSLGINLDGHRLVAFVGATSKEQPDAVDGIEWKILKLVIDDLTEGIEQKKWAGLRLEHVRHDYLLSCDDVWALF